MQQISGVLTGVENWIEVSVMEAEDLSYIGYDGKSVFHSCEQMMSGWEAGFCSSELYYIQPSDEMLNAVGYQGFTYSCATHLLDSVLKFVQKLSELKTNEIFDKWNDEQVEHEKQQMLEFRSEYVYGMDEHGPPDSLYFNVD